MLLQIFAILLAFSIRKVKVKGLDDAKSIGAATYVTSIVLAVIIVATYSLKDVINGFAALFCTGFLIGTTFILILVFVPLVSLHGGLFLVRGEVVAMYIGLYIYRKCEELMRTFPDLYEMLQHLRQITLDLL